MQRVWKRCDPARNVIVSLTVCLVSARSPVVAIVIVIIGDAASVAAHANTRQPACCTQLGYTYGRVGLRPHSFAPYRRAACTGGIRPRRVPQAQGVQQRGCAHLEGDSARGGFARSARHRSRRQVQTRSSAASCSAITLRRSARRSAARGPVPASAWRRSARKPSISSGDRAPLRPHAGPQPAPCREGGVTHGGARPVSRKRS